MKFYGHKLILALIVLFILPGAPAVPEARAAGVLYVASTAVGNGNCSSWANACTLQTALSNAASGDQIWVKKGVYKPTTTTDRTISFALKFDVYLYGGFAGTETSLSQRNPAANITVLSGDIDNNDPVDSRGVTTAIGGNNSYHVVTADGAHSRLDGFIITGGHANGALLPHSQGGGIYSTNSSLWLDNVHFETNWAASQGGGLASVSNLSIEMNNVTFVRNEADQGGGVYNVNTTLRFLNVSFIGNLANYGGGMYNVGSEPLVTNVLFSGNSANYYGGGIYNYSSANPRLTNVTMSYNSAQYGGGIYNFIDSNPRLRNSIL